MVIWHHDNHVCDLFMTLTIRSATLEDQAACVDLLTTLNEAIGDIPPAKTEQLFKLFLQKTRGAIAVADEDGVLLGLATVSYNIGMRYGGEYCQLEELIVDPGARGKNIGGQLVEHSINEARQRGCGEYGLYLVAHTEHNKPFYEKYGLIAVGTEMRRALNS